MGGLLPEATEAKNGLMSAYSAQYSNNLLRRNEATAYYLKLANIKKKDGEGIHQHIEFLLIGGNNYVGNPSVYIIGGYAHHNNKVFSKTKLFGNDILVGYVDNGTGYDIYIEVMGFNHYVRIILLSIGSQSELLNEKYTQKPAGWINI